jgi:hypothetical protein
MAKITGKSGKVDIGGSTIEAKSWTLDISIDEIDASGFESSGATWKDYLFGLKEATGSFEGNLTDSPDYSTYGVGESGTFKLYTDGTDYLTFDATVTGISTNVAVSDEATHTISFRVGSTGVDTGNIT